MPNKSDIQSKNKAEEPSEVFVSKEADNLKEHSRSNRKKRIIGNGIDRHEVIATAAYYRAEKRGFSGGSAMEDWLDAEAEIDSMM